MDIDEHVFYLAVSPDAGTMADEKQISEAKEFAARVKTTREGFQKCISPGVLEGFQKKPSMRFVFIVTQYWLKYRFSELNDEEWQVLYDLLFQRAIKKEMFRKYDLDVSLSLADAQSMFAVRMYPKFGVKLISDIFTTQTDLFKMRFVSAFCRDLTVTEPENEEMARQIQENLMKDGSCAEFQKLLLNRVQGKGQPEDINALAYYARFGDVSWIGDQEFWKIIFEYFPDKRKGKVVVMLWKSVMNRIPEMSGKGAFVGASGIQAAIEQAMNDKFTKKITSYVAEIVAFCGVTFMSPEFFDVAVRLVQRLEVKVPVSLLSFIDLFVLRNGANEVVSKGIECAFERLTGFFANPPDAIMAAEECLADIACTSFVVNQAAVEGLLEGLVMTQGVLDGNAPKIAAAAFMLGEMLSMRLVPSRTLVYLERMKSLVQVEPPISPEMVNALLNVLRLPTVLLDKTNVDIRPYYQVLFALAVQESEFQTKFSRLLVQYFRTFGNVLVSIIGDDIGRIMSVNTVEFATIQGLIIEQSPMDQKAAIIEQALTKIDQILQQCASNRDSVVYCLTLLRNMRSTKQTCEAIQGILVRIMELVQNDDELKSMTIRAIFSLEILGFEMFMTAAKTVDAESPKSLAAIADTARALRRRATQMPASAQTQPIVQAILNNAWIVELGTHICAHLARIAEQCSHMDEDSASPFYPTIISCISFFCSEIKLFVEPSVDQIRTKLHEVISLILTKHYHSPELNEYATLYAHNLADASPNSLAEAVAFLSPSLHFLYATDFDPNDSKWRRVIVRLAKLAVKLAGLNAGVLRESFVKCICEHGGTEPLAVAFLEKLLASSSDQEQRCHATTFFFELMRLRKFH